MASAYLEALRADLEPTLVCDDCGKRNTRHVRHTRIIDVQGHVVCNCGASGSVQEFQEERGR